MKEWTATNIHLTTIILHSVASLQYSLLILMYHEQRIQCKNTILVWISWVSGIESNIQHKINALLCVSQWFVVFYPFCISSIRILHGSKVPYTCLDSNWIFGFIQRPSQQAKYERIILQTECKVLNNVLKQLFEFYLFSSCIQFSVVCRLSFVVCCYYLYLIFIFICILKPNADSLIHSLSQTLILLLAQRHYFCGLTSALRSQNFNFKHANCNAALR